MARQAGLTVYFRICGIRPLLPRVREKIYVVNIVLNAKNFDRFAVYFLSNFKRAIRSPFNTIRTTTEKGLRELIMSRVNAQPASGAAQQEQESRVAIHADLESAEVALDEGSVRDQVSILTERNPVTAPFWQVDRREIFGLPVSLKSDIQCDTVIVGAGIVGLSAAKLLSKSRKVVVLDEAEIGHGASGWNAGILSVATTVDLRIVEQELGAESAQLLVSTLAKTLSETRKELGLGDDVWQSGKSVYVAAKERHRDILESELSIRAQYGLQTKFLDAKERSKLWSGFPYALSLRGEHSVHPVKMLLKLASFVTANGGMVYENSPVASWKQEGDRYLIKSGEHTIEAKNLVLSIGMKSLDAQETAAISKQLVPVTGHVFVTEPSEEIARLVRETGNIAMWDTLELYHYVRYLPDGRVLVGGEELAGSTPFAALIPSDAHIRSLYQWAQSRHTVKLPPIQHCWRASLIIPADGLPLMKVRKSGESLLVSAVTDGLPAGLMLGRAVADVVLCGGDDDVQKRAKLFELLSRTRRLGLESKMLAMLPNWRPLRSLSYRIAFAMLRILDRIP